MSQQTNEDSSSNLDSESDVVTLFKYAETAGCIIVVLFFGAVLYLLTEHLDSLFLAFTFFGSLEEILQFLGNLNENYGFIGIVPILLGLISYYLLFIFIDKAGINVLNPDEREGKFVSLSFVVLKSFNFIILFLLILFLLLKGAYFESTTLLGFYLASRLVFVPLVRSINRVIFNYDALLVISSKKPHETLLQLVSEFSNHIAEGHSWKKFLWSNKMARYSITCYESKAPQYMAAIVVLTVVIGFFCFDAGFNLLTIIYVELTLLYWYLIIKITSQFLTKKRFRVNIFLTSGDVINGVYLIDESNQDYYVFIEKRALSKKTVSKRIMKSVIQKIELSD